MSERRRGESRRSDHSASPARPVAATPPLHRGYHAAAQTCNADSQPRRRTGRGRWRRARTRTCAWRPAPPRSSRRWRRRRMHPGRAAPAQTGTSALHGGLGARAKSEAHTHTSMARSRCGLAGKGRDCMRHAGWQLQQQPQGGPGLNASMSGMALRLATGPSGQPSSSPAAGLPQSPASKAPHRTLRAQTADAQKPAAAVQCSTQG